MVEQLHSVNLNSFKKLHQKTTKNPNMYRKSKKRKINTYRIFVITIDKLTIIHIILPCNINYEYKKVNS